MAAKPTTQTLKERISQMKKVIIEDALRTAEGNVSQVARALGVPQRSLWWTIEQLKIDVESFRK